MEYDYPSIYNLVFSNLALLRNQSIDLSSSDAVRDIFEEHHYFVEFTGSYTEALNLAANNTLSMFTLPEEPDFSSCSCAGECAVKEAEMLVSEANEQAIREIQELLEEVAEELEWWSGLCTYKCYVNEDSYVLNAKPKGEVIYEGLADKGTPIKLYKGKKKQDPLVQICPAEDQYYLEATISNENEKSETTDTLLLTVELYQE